MQINNVLITGVAGFIGSNLLDYLIEKTNWHIDGIDNLSTGNKNNVSNHLNNSRFVFIEDTIGNMQSLKKYDCIFHLAALPRIQPSFEFVTEHITENLTSSMHLVELMIKENYFPKFVFSSSSAIYGTPKIIPTPETEEIDCLSPYAFQKYEVEKYLELLSTRYPLNYVNLRYFNPYGPRSFNPANKFNAYSSVVGIFLYRHQNGEVPLVTGDGSQKRDFIHVYDLAKANYLAAINDKILNTAFNIGNGDTLSVLELAQKISPNYEFIPKREGESDITFADITKAKDLLNWFPEHNISDFIKENS
ncbi:MAG: NAD-dependent epimerase/dehydratase family protein [Bacteroidota bacterium]|nr:NAD-dependent epimerase/dehydratase family protein [Bacteroidota bacterium]MDP3146158.1 NAD-dependent epimerase/dehydratase family protein [Bacteroidota bacterium]